MKDQPANPESAADKPAAGKPRVDPTVPAAAEPPKDRELTPEEQMELYEKDLRENDWGHQPC